MEHVLRGFDCGIYNRSNDSEIGCTVETSESARYFLFDLDVTDGPFRTIVIWQDIVVAKKAKDTLFDLPIID